MLDKRVPTFHVMCGVAVCTRTSCMTKRWTGFVWFLLQTKTLNLNPVWFSCTYTCGTCVCSGCYVSIVLWCATELTSMFWKQHTGSQVWPIENDSFCDVVFLVSRKKLERFVLPPLFVPPGTHFVFPSLPVICPMFNFFWHNPSRLMMAHGSYIMCPV